MYLSKKQVSQLQAVIASTQKILEQANRTSDARRTQKGDGTARRRRGADLTAFKKMIKAERKGGASVADLAQKHGVTPSYIYQLK